jgi:transcriptional regulator with XRE-family HTH domain
MARPTKPEADTAFLARLEECAQQCGSRASLARRAGLTPGSIQNYFEGGEPTRRTLVDLARAANVSVEWLATGEGSKEVNAAPEGYHLSRVFDLTATGNHIRGILDQFGQHPREPKGRLIKQSDLIGKALALSLESYVVENGDGLEFEPEVHAGDIFIFSVPHGHEVVTPSNVEHWDFIEEGGVYLVAIGVELKLRKLRRNKGSVQVIAPSGKVEATLTGRPRDFILFGRIIWRAGVLRGLLLEKQS